MKSLTAVTTIVLLSLLAGCSKKEDLSVSPTVRENVIDRICKPWKMILYTIGTDVGEYSYRDTVLGGHALRTLDIRRDGSYVAASAEWSGTYHFVDDSTGIIFTPYDSMATVFTLHWNDLSDKNLIFNSPTVSLNPGGPLETPYDNFVAYEGLEWLTLHNVDIENIRQVWITLDYYIDTAP
jgi:hypothetical protein